MKLLVGVLLVVVAGTCAAAEAYRWVDEHGIVNYGEKPPEERPALPAVRGMEFDTYIRLQRGMTEGELLVRAGRPDYETVDSLFDYDRTLYYFPTVANPYTTVVRMRSGTIVSLDRIKKF